MNDAKLFTVFQMEKLLIKREHMDFITPTNAVNEKHEAKVAPLNERIAKLEAAVKWERGQHDQKLLLTRGIRTECSCHFCDLARECLRSAS